MHVFDESTNIAANLHYLWLIFRQAFQEDNFTGKFLHWETKKAPDVTPLTTYQQYPPYPAKNIA